MIEILVGKMVVLVIDLDELVPLFELVLESVTADLVISSNDRFLDTFLVKLLLELKSAGADIPFVVELLVDPVVVLVDDLIGLLIGLFVLTVLAYSGAQKRIKMTQLMK